MKPTLWLCASALAAALAAGPAVAAGGSQSKMQQGASAGAGQASMQDQATIRQAQKKLQQMGYQVGEVDGVWGPQTQSALRQYQQQEGLQASGQLDRQTMAKLGIESGTAAGASGSGAMGGSSGMTGGMGSGSGMSGGSSSQPSMSGQGSSGGMGSGSGASGGSSGGTSGSTTR